MPRATTVFLFLLGVLAAPGLASHAPVAVEVGPALRSYTLSAPDLHVLLPARLSEVSGVTALSETEVATVQDEDGIVFVYDLARQRVVRSVRFGPPGDYEDIAAVGERLFVLRSDGVLFEIDALSAAPRVSVHALRLPTADNEGLCFDGRNRQLLIAPKSRAPGKKARDLVSLFAFDLGGAALRPAPVLVLGVDEIRAYAEREGGTANPRRQKRGRKAEAALHFMPSALAIHPVTREVFVLSGVDRVLATFDAGGRVTGIAALDPALFRQPEGLTFLPGGDMVITNEAAGRKATLLLFKRR